MSGFEATRAAIEARLQANFSALPIRFENQPGRDPADAAHVKAFLRFGDARNVSVGAGPLRRQIGLLVVQIFVPENTGTAAATAHADTIEAIFRNVTVSPSDGSKARFRVPRAIQLGTANGFFQLNVECPFARDVT